MKWGSFIVVTLVVLFIILFEKPRMARYPAKDKLAFAVLLAFGWGITLLLVLYPEVPGPTDVVEAIYRPLGRLLR
ncbi:hypothetical protein PAESOLCIP111_04615 [Paenibacillus solanacearum]|uniref:Uncharacterized protein n=1 Tax=Paenibacillus solanacearum TaxID=2048548 RepID=A0A916NRM2_9BACL|nr:hypothetical protein [Paenibacillus solanacearum]CAG7644065.1 hypothetical protein PAESOLCIP111_04615 [Paenibacillus solanacearum]